MDYETKRKIKKIFFFIILLGIFLYLALYISFTVINIVNQSKKISEQEKAQSLDCTEFSFNIQWDTLKYENNNLQFEVTNTIGEQFSYLVVEVDGQKYTYELEDFIRGGYPNKVIVENITIKDSVLVYPKGCINNVREITI